MAKPIKFKDLYIELPDGNGELDQYYVTGYYWVVREPEIDVKYVEDFMIDKVEKNGEDFPFVRQSHLSQELLDAINEALGYLI